LIRGLTGKSNLALTPDAINLESCIQTKYNSLSRTAKASVIVGEFFSINVISKQSVKNGRKSKSIEE
jgi:hypothetical protein